MKTMNQAKLAAMPLPKIKRACFIHAERAIAAKQTGNTNLYEMHAGLLDQCAQVARKIIYPSHPQQLADGDAKAAIERIT